LRRGPVEHHSEVGCADAARWRCWWFAWLTGGVESDDGVEVGQRPALEFHDFHERNPCLIGLLAAATQLAP
jgi:hypothetical protein